MKTIYGIQYLRAFAALAVVVFHAAEKTGHHFAIGAAGVDVFFVISGFIMWVISDRRPLTPLAFLVERIRRIGPVYWLATLVMVAGGLAGLFPNLVVTVQHLAASLLFIPARSPSNGEIWPVLVQGWTLNFEIFFYLVFALSLTLPRRFRLATVAAFFVLLVLAGGLFETGNALFLTYTRPIMLEFVAGMLIGQLWLTGRVPGPRTGMLLVAAALAGFAGLEIFKLPFDAFKCGPLAIALVSGILALEAAGKVGRWRPLAFLGDASYSVYIWHTFAISVLVKFGMAAGIGSGILFPAAVVAGVIAGSIAYVGLERPLTQLLRSNRPNTSPKAVQAKNA
ncbi:acyltransferase family protein [Pararhizobium gei]|uniref:acyltransferase family protein n=1 Tax=Pararhizobium gei TaxID=1395951 RepID=UPI0023DB71DE|nr:acyltransferase [Rhizobium gei]